MISTDDGNTSSPIYFTHIGKCTEALRHDRTGEFVPMEQSLRLFPIELGQSLNVELTMPDEHNDDFSVGRQ